MLDFTESLMYSRMDLLPATQNNSKWPKIKKEKNSSWKTYIYVIRCLRVKILQIFKKCDSSSK